MFLTSQTSLHAARGGRRNVDCEDGVLAVCSVTLQDTVCTLLSRTTAATHLEEREAELELQRLEKKDEPGEAVSERWRHFLLTTSVMYKIPFFLPPVC